MNLRTGKEISNQMRNLNKGKNIENVSEKMPEYENNETAPTF